MNWNQNNYDGLLFISYFCSFSVFRFHQSILFHCFLKSGENLQEYDFYHNFNFKLCPHFCTWYCYYYYWCDWMFNLIVQIYLTCMKIIVISNFVEYLFYHQHYVHHLVLAFLSLILRKYCNYYSRWNNLLLLNSLQKSCFQSRPILHRFPLLVHFAHRKAY